MTITPHLKRALIAKSVITETGLTRKARTRHCRCGLAVIACIDDLGLDAIAWPTPTTTLGELVAALAGLRTWHHAASSEALIARGPHTIRAKPADTVRVLVQHRCGDPPPERADTATSAPAAPDYHRPPPF